MEDEFRRAARVLLVDDRERVLLFHGFDSSAPSPYWFTPGGGLDPDESPADGAARELAEETGLRVPPAALGAPVHRETVRFRFDGRAFCQEQDFFLLRTPPLAVVTAGFDEVERRSIDAHRWWPLDELAATTDVVYPEGLAGLVSRVLGEARC
ncbi:DNA mismatch repair protein MutT [Pilimelia anulata]|uniref:DNA mismatch repair protein MutT n=1 Tax=Pilimelia anulata TaxID=53371 RepID=A0A8J3B721_9ACTN|nr:NUDIX domain-containing protein [Pilimelia anulata]GGJ76776.1 DNA mismatch repair protein MutT [Pilimelia anulata]